MPVMVISTMPGGTPELYDRVKPALDVEGDPPEGLLAHMMGLRGEGFEVINVWETREHFDTFLDGRLRPAIKSVVGDEAYAAMPEAEREYVELHDIVVP